MKVYFAIQFEYSFVHSVGAWHQSSGESFGKKVAEYNQHWQDTICFFAGKSRVDAIFIVQGMQECFYAEKKKKLFKKDMYFVDLAKEGFCSST